MRAWVGVTNEPIICLIHVSYNTRKQTNTHTHTGSTSNKPRRRRRLFTIPTATKRNSFRVYGKTSEECKDESCDVRSMFGIGSNYFKRKHLHPDASRTLAKGDKTVEQSEMNLRFSGSRQMKLKKRSSECKNTRGASRNDLFGIKLQVTQINK